MNEFVTADDIARAIDARVNFGASVEDRRLRARGTYWMAMALDQLQAATLCLEDEALPLALRRADDDMKQGWLTLTLRFVRPEVCPGWTMLNLDAVVGGRSRNDTIVANDASGRGIPVITRDAGVARKVRSRGGEVMTPETFAASVLPRDVARRRFFERYDARAPGWAWETAPDGTVDWLLTKRQCEGLKWWRIRLEYIWSDRPGDFVLRDAAGRETSL
jgi:hypothetical protein